MLVSVKMKTKNKMIISLLLIITITASLVPVYAAPINLAAEKRSIERVKPAKITDRNAKPFPTLARTQQLEAYDISSLDESTIDERIDEAEKAISIDDDSGAPLWYLYAYGYSTISDPVVDAAETRFRIKLQMVATKIKNTEFGALYKVHWGRVTHDGEPYTVSGYALLDSDGVFYMKLDGETAFKAIGQIHAAQFGVRVSMKGYLVDDEITYTHVMRGRAIPLTNNLFSRLRNHLQ